MRRRNSDEEFRRLERAWRAGDPDAIAGIAAMNLRGQIPIDRIAAITGAKTPRRAIAEAEYLLVEGWGKLGTPSAKQAWIDLATSRDNVRRWLATVIKRKIVSKTWAIAACDAAKEAWPAAISEGGGYGLSDLRPEEDGDRRGDYISPIVVYAVGETLDHLVRYMGPFYPEGRNAEGEPEIYADYHSDPSDTEDFVDEGLISYADLGSMAERDGFDSVQEWIDSHLAEPTPLFPNPVEDRAQFAASLWESILSYGGGGDSTTYAWPEFERNHALEIAWENADWLR